MRILLALSALLCAAVAAPAGAADVEKIYVLDCGTQTGSDQGRWSPGVNDGKPITFGNMCVLIRHPRGVMLWDTGLADAIAAMPGGLSGGGGLLLMKRNKTLVAQLAELGLKPADIPLVAVSHTHADHAGNIALFTGATVLIQEAEYDFSQSAQVKTEFAASQKIEKLKGDRDVFGDGSVLLLSTPGHTPGHQSILIHLKNTGAVIVTGDAAHFQDNWDARRVPGFNFNKEQSSASMERLAKMQTEQKAQLWITHDKPTFDRLKHAPTFYD
jgi:N-acyl homoserine lactone hydrolase